MAWWRLTHNIKGSPQTLVLPVSGFGAASISSSVGKARPDLEHFVDHQGSTCVPDHRDENDCIPRPLRPILPCFCCCCFVFVSSGSRTLCRSQGKHVHAWPRRIEQPYTQTSHTYFAVVVFSFVRRDWDLHWGTQFLHQSSLKYYIRRALKSFLSVSLICSVIYFGLCNYTLRYALRSFSPICLPIDMSTSH